MYLYVNNRASSEVFPNNSPINFITEFSQTIDTRDSCIGLCEIAMDLSRGAFDPRDLPRTGFYVMVSECDESYVGGHTHPVVRMFSSNEFFVRLRAVLRFPDVIYVPLKEFNLSRLSVKIVKASDCCTDNSAESINAKGLTYCTFHIKKQDFTV